MQNTQSQLAESTSIKTIYDFEDTDDFIFIHTNLGKRNICIKKEDGTVGVHKYNGSGEYIQTGNIFFPQQHNIKFSIESMIKGGEQFMFLKQRDRCVILGRLSSVANLSNFAVLVDNLNKIMDSNLVK